VHAQFDRAFCIEDAAVLLEDADGTVHRARLRAFVRRRIYSLEIAFYLRVFYPDTGKPPSAFGGGPLKECNLADLLRAGPTQPALSPLLKSLSHFCRKYRPEGRFCRLCRFITTEPSIVCDSCHCLTRRPSFLLQCRDHPSPGQR
jgi:hypothetical protein